MARRTRSAALTALAGAVSMWATLYFHILWVFGIARGYIDGGVYPLYPGLPVTPASLMLDASLAPVLCFLPAFLIALLTPPGTGRLIVLGAAYAVIWVMCADGLAGLFAADFGTTWQRGEPFAELFFQPALTPVLLILGLSGQLLPAWRLGPRATNHAGPAQGSSIPK